MRLSTLAAWIPVIMTPLLLVPPASGGEAEWPAWRGQASAGSLPEGRFPDRWGTNDIAWSLPLPGKGGSTPIVSGGRIYLTSPLEGQDALLAVDRAGHQLWATRLGGESTAKHRNLGSSCNASPVTDGKTIYTYFRSGRLTAVALDGTIRWQEDIAGRFGPENLFWDQGSSPVLTSRDVILTRLHHGESWIAAFDKGSGKLRWQQKRNYEAPSENDNAYTTPLLFEHGGKPALLVWGADHLTAHAAEDGHLLWSCGGFNPEGTAHWPAISCPVIQGNMVVVPVGRDDHPGQGHLCGVRLGGSGDVTATHSVWRRDDIAVFVPALAEDRGRVYLLRHRGEVVCVDPASGRTLWAEALPRGTASYYASPAIGGGLLYAAREDGVVFTARVREKFELLSEVALGERVVASPALATNRLLIRGDRHLFCIDMAHGGTQRPQN
ncbi:MAG TPA: Pyrrolo-quinoline quinone [Verrucomicrobiales bacterium]|nr:Pyrrolo-quinoline quinone [Verrucomicrobiales bacterium]